MVTGSSIIWGFAQYWICDFLLTNNLWPLRENRDGFVHSFTRRQTETAVLTKVADGGKVHSVTGSHFTDAVLRAVLLRRRQAALGYLFGFGGAWCWTVQALLKLRSRRSKMFPDQRLPRGMRSLEAGESVLLSSEEHVDLLMPYYLCCASHDRGATFNQRLLLKDPNFHHINSTFMYYDSKWY